MLSISRFGFGFLTGTTWDPVFEEFGALPFIYGTLVSSLLALLIGGPISLGAAIYLSELAPDWLRDPLSFLVELLAAIPSVVYGLWGIFVLVPWLRTAVEPFLGQHPRLPAPLPGSGLRVRDAGRGADPGHHDHPDHRRGLPGCDAGGAQHPAGGDAGPGRHPLGDDPDGGAALRPVRHRRGGDPRAGARPGRDDGGDHGDRQPAGDLRPPSSPPPTPWPASSPTSSPRPPTTSTWRALVEIGLVLFGVTLLLNVVARLLVWRVAYGPTEEA